MTSCLLWDHVAEEKEILDVALAPTINRVLNELKEEGKEEKSQAKVKMISGFQMTEGDLHPAQMGIASQGCAGRSVAWTAAQMLSVQPSERRLRRHALSSFIPLTAP